MSTKKVKNASESAKVNKGFGTGTKPTVSVVEKKEVEKVGDLVDTIGSTLEVTTTTEVANTSDLVNAVVPDNSEDLIDPDLDVDFSFGRAQKGFRTKPARTERSRTNQYKDKPTVYIAGSKHELVKLDKAPKTPSRASYYRESDNPIDLKDGPGQRYSPDNLITKEPIQWYHASLPEIDLYVTQGSEVTIDERIMPSYGWEGEEGDWIEPVEGKKPQLYVIGSVLKCRSISIGSSLEVNNSFLETTGHIDGVCSKVSGSRINIKDSIDIYSSSLYNCCIEGCNRLAVRNSRYLRLLNLSGFDTISLIKVGCNGTFRINCGWSSVPGLNLDIADIQLVDFAASFHDFNTVFAKQFGAAKPWMGNGLQIRRRTDYGYFSGSQPVAFVRAGAYNIATSNSLYLAEEIDQVSFPKEKKELGYQPQFGVGLRPYGEGYSALEDNSYTMGLRGGKLWEKARKDCFSNPNHSGSKRPIGMIGDNLIQSLVEQIKSRVKLYVELAVLTEV